MAGRHVWHAVPVVRPVGPGWMLTYTVTGRAYYQDPAGSGIPVPPGDMVLLRGGASAGRGVDPGQRWDAYWLRFEPWRGWQPDGFVRLADGLYHTHITRPGHRQRLQEAWQSIIFDLQARETARILGAVTPTLDDHHMRDEALQKELTVLRLREIFILAVLDASAAAHIDPRIRDALEKLERQVAEPLDVRQLAAQVGLSYSRFAFLFKTQVGASAKRVQLSIRLRRAAASLAYTDDSVTAIARRTGFSTIYEFSRTFRREYGESPTAYRARHRADAHAVSPRYQ